MDTITKKVFLNTITCPTLGWITSKEPDVESTSISEKLRMEEGLEIHQRARTIFPEAQFIKGDNETAAKRTQELLKEEGVKVIFEATFLAKGVIAKADILKKEESGWHLIEVKSKVKGDEEIKGKDREDLIDDIAYTAMVANQSGVNIIKCSLMLISKNYRLGMTNDKLFAEIECTQEALTRAKELMDNCDQVLQTISMGTKPTSELKWDCKKCDIFRTCLGKGIENHIFELPRINEKKFSEFAKINVLTIEEIPAGFSLTPNQAKVKEAVDSGRTIVNQAGLKTALSSAAFPAYYLDFETVQTAIPLYPNIAPYEQIPTQYSIHICSSPEKIEGHYEYLANPSKDCRRELVEKLINDCGNKGSIIVYTQFEKTRINGLIGLFPDLKEKLEAIIKRIVDINKIISDNLYHPEFHGSSSIKVVLPVLVPDLNYENMDVSNGLDASATFAYLAKARYIAEEAEEKRKQLLEYCKLDTMAMVKLHQHLKAI